MSDDITQRTVLNSGLRILTGRVSDAATNYYDIRVTVNSGYSDDEIDGQAHFLEHMLFNGVNTSNGFVDYRTLRQTREKEGIIFGAYTTPVKTVYTARVPTNLGEEGLNKAVDELSRMVISPALPEDRVEHEKKVICNEWGHRQGVFDIYLYEQACMNGFKSNPAFGHRGLGEKEDILNFDRQSLLNFLTDHYVQSNTSVTVTGPVDHEKIVRTVQDKFSDMPLSTRPDYAPETPLEFYHDVKGISFIPHNFFLVAFPWPGENELDNSPVADLAESVIGYRLNNNIREEGGNTYGLSVGTTRFRHEGHLNVTTSTQPETTARMIKDIAFEIRQIANGDISEELGALRRIFSNLEMSTLTNSEFLSNALASTDSSFRTLYSPEERIAQLNDVTAQDIQSVVRTALSGSVLFTGIGVENAFPPRAELESIFALQDAPSGSTLRQDFGLK